MSWRIDSHQHFWRYTRDDFDWIDDRMAALRTDFLPRHLLPFVRALQHLLDRHLALVRGKGAPFADPWSRRCRSRC